jgi:tetrahydromethanopterin S-methyltransferase subunit G
MTTVVSAHNRLDKLEPKIDQLEKDVSSVKTEVHVQFKEVFNRINRIEAILITVAGAIIAMLASILVKMG